MPLTNSGLTDTTGRCQLFLPAGEGDSFGDDGVHEPQHTTTLVENQHPWLFEVVQPKFYGCLMNLGDRIRQARKVAGMTQTQLADASGMSQQMISKLESGGSPATSNIVAIAMALNVSAEWLDSGEKKLEPTEPGPEFVPIERVKLKVSAGVTGFTVEHLDGNGPPVYYRADWLKEEGLRAERLFALRVSGDSMQPSLWDGDLIVVNTEDKVKDGSYQKIQPGLLTLYYSGCILLPNTPPSRRAGGEDAKSR